MYCGPLMTAVKSVCLHLKVLSDLISFNPLSLPPSLRPGEWVVFCGPYSYSPESCRALTLIDIFRSLQQTLQNCNQIYKGRAFFHGVGVGGGVKVQLYYFSYSSELCCGSGIRCLFDPWILNLGSRSRIPSPYFWELSDILLGKKFYNSLKIGPNLFLQHFKNRIINNFVIFVATKKSMTTYFFHPPVFGPGIRDPGWVKSGSVMNIPDQQHWFRSQILSPLTGVKASYAVGLKSKLRHGVALALCLQYSKHSLNWSAKIDITLWPPDSKT